MTRRALSAGGVLPAGSTAPCRVRGCEVAPDRPLLLLLMLVPEEEAAGLLLLRRETSPRGVAAKDIPPSPGRSGAPPPPPSTRYLSPLGIHTVILWPFASTSFLEQVINRFWFTREGDRHAGGGAA